MGRIGDYEAIATGKSKRETKQRISQLILQRIHPTIVLWKELFPLYSNRLKQLEVFEFLKKYFFLYSIFKLQKRKKFYSKDLT